MNYEVSITILDKGYLVQDGDYNAAVTSGSELLNTLARIKQTVEAEEDYEDEDEHD